LLLTFFVLFKTNRTLMQAQALCSQVFVVVGFGAEQVRQAFDDDSISWVEQSEQLGTGHAVQQVMPYINDDSISLVLYGDVPLIRQSTLENLIVQAQKSGVNTCIYFTNRKLLSICIFLLNNRLNLIILTHNTPITCWIIEHHRKECHATFVVW
jgi:molybdopterin-guanine dinucleotide biosynthesis protein A